MGLSNVVALSIMVTAAATLHVNGITQIDSSAQAAHALRLLAGVMAETIFALGIVGKGLLAVPVLAGSAAYAVGEALRWPTGLDRKARHAKALYATIAVATLIGVGLNFSPINPIRALYWSAVINGVVAVPIMAMMMLMAVQSRIMGKNTIGAGLRAVGWLSTAQAAEILTFRWPAKWGLAHRVAREACVAFMEGRGSAAAVREAFERAAEEAGILVR